jgi:endonuclease YncB( thermonuclease family)
MKLPPKKFLIPAFLLLALFIRFVPEIGQDPVPRERFRIVRVIDGDTVELTGRDRLRLLGIDCPEKGDFLYDSAASFLSHLVLGKSPQVLFSGRRRDRYGRLLGYVYLDSMLVNEEILKNGLGYLYLFADNVGDTAHIQRLLAAQAAAIDNGRGIWSQPYRQEEFYLAVKGSFRFHRPSCGSVKNLGPADLIKFETRLEAFKKGYSPCRNCRP